MVSKPERCEVCGDKPGEIGQHFPDDVPLGDLDCCELCGRWACPVCLDRWDCCDKGGDDAD